MKRKIFDLGLIFIAAFLTVHFLHILFVCVAALSIDFQHPIIMFSKMDLDISEMEKWDRSKIVILYLLPTLVTLGTIPLAWLLKFKTPSKKILLKLFYTWIIVISAAFFISYVLVAPFYRRGLGIVAEWFYISNEALLGASLFILPLIPLVGYLFRKPFLKIAHTRSVLKNKWTRLEYLLGHILFPYLVGSALILVMFFASPSYSNIDFLEVEMLRFLILTIILIFILGFNFNKRFIGLEKSQRFHVINLPLVIVTICIIVTLFITLSIV